MKRGIVFGLLFGYAVVLTFMVVKTEAYARLWKQRAYDAVLTRYAQEQNKVALEAVRMLAVENGLLCEREAKATKFVLSMEEENIKLKGALAESVENMEALIKENNKLNNEIINLRYRIQCLEKAFQMTELELPDIPKLDFGGVVNFLKAMFIEKGNNNVQTN